MIFPVMERWVTIHKSINMIHHIRRLKDTNHVIISLSVERPLKNIQHSFIVKVLEKLRIQKTYMNIIKAICIKLTANNINPKERETQTFP